jgi:hypothetical protein
MAIVPGTGTGKSLEAMPQMQFPPGLTGYNREPDLSLRRVTTLDVPTRVAAQLEHDRGVYVRPPVQAVEYAPGNIKTSHYPMGVAGYNPRVVAAPDSADDMNQTQYMLSVLQNKPEERLRMQQELLLLAKQNFLNTRVVPTDYALNTHNTMNNLMDLAKAKLSRKA